MSRAAWVLTTLLVIGGFSITAAPVRAQAGQTADWCIIVGFDDDQTHFDYTNGPIPGRFRWSFYPEQHGSSLGDVFIRPPGIGDDVIVEDVPETNFDLYSQPITFAAEWTQDIYPLAIQPILTGYTVLGSTNLRVNGTMEIFGTSIDLFNETFRNDPENDFERFIMYPAFAGSGSRWVNINLEIGRTAAALPQLFDPFDADDVVFFGFRVFGRGAIPTSLIPDIASESIPGGTIYSNRFSTDYCTDLAPPYTPTPAPPTLTPLASPSLPYTSTPAVTATSTPSPTPSPTPTITPTATATSGVVCGLELEIDFNSNNTSYETTERGTISGGELVGTYGGTNQAFGELIILLPSTTTLVTHVEWDKTAGAAGQLYIMTPDGYPIFNQGFGPGSGRIGFAGDFTVAEYAYKFRIASHTLSQTWPANSSIDNIWVEYCAEPPTPTPTPSYTYTPTLATLTRTPSPTRTPNPTNTPRPTQTPGGPTATRTITPRPIVTATIGPSRTPTNTFAPIIIPTLVPTATRTPTAFTPSPPPPTATQATLTSPTPGTPGTPIPNPTGTPDYTGAGNITTIGSGLINIVSNTWQVTTQWLGSVGATFTGVLDAWDATPPEPVPGLPVCASEPLSSQLCAIWYILEWTVFSGPVGSLIMPLGTAVVDMAILFIFIKQVRAIIARAAEILKV